MSIVSNEIIQQFALAMLHDVDNQLIRLSQVKSALLTGMGDYLQMQSTLDVDSPEVKIIEKKRQQLAAYEKKIDAEIQQFQNRKQKLEGLLQKSTDNVNKAIARAYGGGR